MKLRNLLLAMSLLNAGCGGRAIVKNNQPPPAQPVPAAAVPVSVQSPVSTPQPPSLADVHPALSDLDYRNAQTQVGDADVNPLNVDPYLVIAQYRFNHSDYSESLKICQKVLLTSGNPSEMSKAQYMEANVYFEKKDFLPSLAAYQDLLKKYPNSPYVDRSNRMTDFILSYSLTLPDLQSFVANYPDSPARCSALFQLGSREIQAGSQNDASVHLSDFLQKCPQHPSAASAQLLMQTLQSQQTGKAWKIGVLVPLTGRFKGFGESVLNGVKLAVAQANQNGVPHKPLSVSVRDTMSDPIQAVKAFQDLTKDDGLDAVIGPVGPAEISAVAPLANQQKITLLSPAVSREGLSSLGPYLFSNSMTNQMQGRAIAKFAVGKLGLKRFAVLAPEDGYGEVLSDAFTKTVEAMGATVTGAQTYPPNSTDFKASLMALGGQDPGSAKENERGNNRKMEELKYAIGKEIGKILIRSRDLATVSRGHADAAPALALVPPVESLINTGCPSILKDVDSTVRAALAAQTDLDVRDDDLVRQALTRLPVEFKGTTRTASADVWADISQDVKASLVVTGQVVETTPPNDLGNHPTWDYSVNLQAYQYDPKKKGFGRIYQSRLAYSAFKPVSLLRSNNAYQALYLPAHASEISQLVSQIHFYDLNPVFLGGHLWENESVLQESAKDLEGSYFVSGFYVDGQQGVVKKFTDDYLATFAKRPDLLAAQAYDAARLLMRATESAATRDDVHTQLLLIKDFDGASGKTSFDGKGEADKEVPVLKVQDGRIIQVQ